jgi:hypothetical protein
MSDTTEVTEPHVHIQASNYDFDSQDADREPNPHSWGIDFQPAPGEGDWIFDSDDLTKEQADLVVALLLNHWPTVEAVEAAIEDGSIADIDKVVAAVKAGTHYVVCSIHQGTDGGIFRATVTDILEEWAMTEDDARKCTMGRRLYDFGDDFYVEEADEEV